MTSQQKDKVPYFRNMFAKNSPKSAIDELIAAKIATLGTPALVRVEHVEAKEGGLTGRVSVHLLVHQQDALNRGTGQQRVLHGVPYLRVQGGTSAIIIDPKPGDIGFIVIAGRDHSNVMAARSEAPPASFRQFSMSDCVYIGGFLNDAPNQYIQFTDSGVRIVTPGTVEIQAAGITANCDIKTSGDIVAGGISLKNHIHSGVETGGGKTGEPE